MQRVLSRREREDVRRWVFANRLDSDVETLVRKWLVQWLDGFYCGLQVMYMPHFIGPTLARTHVVLNNARYLNALDTVKAIVEATGLSPYLSVFGWPFCLNDVDNMGGGCDVA